MRGARAGYWEWYQDASALFLSEGAADLVGLTDGGRVPLEDLLQPTMDEIDAIASQGGLARGVPTGFVWGESDGEIRFHPAFGLEG